jgi:hypothetical protein
MIDPEFGAEQWDRLHLGSMHSPGVCRLSGPGLVYGWDIQNATAQAGAITKRVNEPLKEFSAEFELSNEPDEFGFTDFDRWDDFQSYLEPMANRQKPFPRDVYHPDLARVHITAVTVKSIGMAAPDGKGGAKISVAFIEHRPPKPLKPIASTKTEGDKLIDEEVAKTKALQNEWKTLGSNPTPQSVGDTL